MHYNCVERPLSKFFYRYGKVVSRHPLLFIIIPLLMTAGCSTGFLFRETVLDALYLYTPNNAPSRYERATIHEHWPLTDGHFQPGKSVTDLRQCQVTVSSVDGGNILGEHYIQEVLKLNTYVLSTISTRDEFQVEHTYQDLCLAALDGGCYDNPIIGLIQKMYNLYPNNLTFPSFRFGLRKIYLASSLGGVNLRPGTNIVRSAKSLLLMYQLKFHPANVSILAGTWERAFEEAMLNYHSDYLKLTFYHSQSLALELKKNADHVIPKFAITFTVLILFSVLCSTSLIPRTFYIDWLLSKPMVALLGIFNAGIAVVSAIGLLCLCGVYYSEIVSVMPFLVISVGGTNNMFLMLAAWRGTHRTLSTEERMAESLSEAGVAMSITMLTDILSFGVGIITNIPAVQIFCIYTCMAITFTIFYQMTFFAGVVALYGRLESSGRHSLLFIPVQSGEKASFVNPLSRFFMLGDVLAVHKSHEHQKTWSTMFFTDWYVPVLLNPVVKSAILVWLLIYLAFAGYGCTQLRQGLKPERLLVTGSYVIDHFETFQQYFWNYGPEVQVMVNNASVTDLATQKGRDQAWAMVDAFANTSHTIGRDGLQFWLETYEHYLRVMKLSWNNESFWSILRNDFLPLNSYLRDDLVWQSDSENNSKVVAYRFTLGMKDFASTEQQKETMLLMREVASNYPEMNITTFNFFWLFADQYLVILGNVLQDLGIGLVCLICMALVLIPHPLCSLWVALVIISIDIGVMGFMTFWGVNLDAISMITLVMSMGFSVDFSAHVSYGYVVSKETTAQGRLSQALGALGWPILQGGVSTVLGVMAMSTVDSYMIITFFKTVLLVIILGLIHGLIFLPVLLTVFLGDACFNHALCKRRAPNKSLSMKSEANLPGATAAGEYMHGDDTSQWLYGRYAIYLPRLLPYSEYDPDKGAVLSWNLDYQCYQNGVDRNSLSGVRVDNGRVPMEMNHLEGSRSDSGVGATVQCEASRSTWNMPGGSFTNQGFAH